MNISKSFSKSFFSGTIKKHYVLCVLILIMITFITSCQKDSSTNNNSNRITLIGSWINQTGNGELLNFEKSISLKEDDYGFTFYPDNSFIERKNAGWCGTPPITYKDFDGTWILKDSIVEISVGYWGGIANYKWKIISISNNKLTIRVEDAKYYER